MASKSKILSIGGTGYIGKFIVEASVKAGHQTFVLVRESTLSDPSKSQLLDHFKNLGVNFVIGDVLNHESLVKAIKQVDVVISTVGHTLIADQVKIIAAIKEAGNVKRFFPSEFGIDDDRIHGAVEPAKSTYDVKAKIRRAVEAEGIPYTYVASYGLNGHFLPNLSQPEATAPPRDKVVILGDGNPKEAAPPLGRLLSIYHSAFVEGVQTDFKIEPSFGVEASQLYPDVKYTTVDEYLNQFV
ncbi:Phenylcoumaran benzylic ether reductase 1 [Citrus sinensis]|nr:Phenylcoumaran benzylic ether reductase 1 [Citrus sinensis]